MGTCKCGGGGLWRRVACKHATEAHGTAEFACLPEKHRWRGGLRPQGLAIGVLVQLSWTRSVLSC